METRIVLIVLLIIVLVILARCIRVVQQSKAYVIERLGAFHTVWSVGLHFKIPFIDRVQRVVSLKEQVADFPPPSLSLPRTTSPSRSTRSSTSKSRTPSSTPMGWKTP